MSPDAEKFLTLLTTGKRLPNYAAVTNSMSWLLKTPDEWVVLGSKRKPRFYPVFNDRGRAVINELYLAGKVSCEFPGISPDVLQNYCPSGVTTDGCLSEGLEKEP